MFPISPKLKQRFCKDQKISIDIFSEPYFSDRVALFDRFYDVTKKYITFQESLEHYNDELEYLADYNRIKDEAISFIKSSESYDRLNRMDMGVFNIEEPFKTKYRSLYSPENDGRRFVSVDLRQANFNTLKRFGYDMFDSDTWEDFLRKFTDNKHIISSKYIRQVILGNCNPGRHIRIEIFEMHKLMRKLEKFLSNFKDSKEFDNIATVHNDEFVFDVTEFEEREVYFFMYFISGYNFISGYSYLPVNVTYFKLFHLGGNGYLKCFTDRSVEIKSVEIEYLPMVMKKLLGWEITSEDKTFYFRDCLVKFLETPKWIENVKALGDYEC